MSADILAMLIVCGTLWREMVRVGRARGLGGFEGVGGWGFGAMSWMVLDRTMLRGQEGKIYLCLLSSGAVVVACANFVPFARHDGREDIGVLEMRAVRFFGNSDLVCGACFFFRRWQIWGVMKLDKQRCEVDVWRANGRSAFHSANGFRRHVSWSGVFADGLYRND
jgi:hypothetical protein